MLLYKNVIFCCFTASTGCYPCLSTLFYVNYLATDKFYFQFIDSKAINI
ncbi:hypothetical protein PROVRETT_06359 [Providencia rettgeri DSM 1131]|nr:hypothetical protein PROVRETT_06359 [Providencia rettgeri DSM 1131]